MKNYDLEKIKKNDWVTTYFEEKREEGTYLFVKDEFRVVDAYGYDGSVEISHREYSGYNVLRSFNLLDSTTTLDLTWMRSIDEFDLSNIKQQEYIKELKVNVDNLDYSYYKPEYNVPIILTICYGNKKIGFFKKIKKYKQFIEYNKEIIESVRFENLPSLMEKILITYTEKQDIKVCEKEKAKVKVK